MNNQKLSEKVIVIANQALNAKHYVERQSLLVTEEALQKAEGEVCDK